MGPINEYANNISSKDNELTIELEVPYEVGSHLVYLKVDGKPVEQAQFDFPQVTSTVDFYVSKVYLLSIEENGGCMGGHSMFIDVLDVNGKPLLNAKIADPPNFDFVRVSGEKNEVLAPLGHHIGNNLAEIVLWGEAPQLKVVEYPVGNLVSSDSSPKLSVNDEEIFSDELKLTKFIQSGYCNNEVDCETRLNDNSLCRGHYSFYVAFQATHPFF